METTWGNATRREALVMPMPKFGVLESGRYGNTEFQDVFTSPRTQGANMTSFRFQACWGSSSTGIVKIAERLQSALVAASKGV